MLRSRVRRSFTVEVKSKNRHTPSWPEDPTPSPVNWAALDPAPETPSPFDACWPDEAASAPAAPAEKPRRILPSLIVAEPEPETVEPASTREPRLPRVRRVKPPQARSEESHAEAARPEVTRSAAIWSFADIANAASEPAVAALPPVEARPTPVAPVPVASRKAARPRTAKPALAPGERWKRRLPRSCR